MNEKTVRRKLRETLRRYGTRDPFEIARARGIQVRFLPMRAQKGFSVGVMRNYFIYINENLSEQMQRTSCAHELAHVLLHREYLDQRPGMMNMSLYERSSQTEYEADLFAALLLIEDDELIACLRQGMDIASAASCLDVNVNHVALKLAEMRRKGLPVDLPFTPDSRFLGRIEDRADSL